VDDVINVAGHRLSTAEMEEVVASHPQVAECAVFGVHCDLKGQKPLALVVLKPENTLDNKTISDEIVKDIRKEIGAVASLREVVVVKRLPKTRSGKILRKLLRNISDELEYNVPSTIDDVKIISEIEHVFKENQIGIHS
jgi:propionyl-CoA synthetase